MKPAVRDRLDRTIEDIGPLPVLSGTVARVRKLSADPDATTPQLVATIDDDEAFSTNLLRYANSAAYARPLRARTIHQAVTMVGRDALARIATESATYSLLEQMPGTGGRSRGAMHLHAVSVASCAVEVAQRTGASTEVVHLAALLHDIGKLVMPLAFGADAVDEIAREQSSGSARVSLERERLGVDHAFAGALLADQEGIRGELFETISFHHGGLPGPESPTREIACVQLGNVVVGMLAGDEADQELVHVALEQLGATPSLLDEVAEAALPKQTPSATGAANDGLAARIASLERLASTDELTGLANRREWLARTRTRLAGDENGAVLVCDVDRFKQINDKVGHLTADLVLTEIARVLGRHGDAGRLGGDEFAVWLSCNAAAAEQAATAIVEEVCTRLPGDGELPAVSVSIGVALSGEHGRELTNLLEAADTALYQAKEAGRARAALAAG
ncbi:MAG TPA: HDOD domain-containing protein [Conexibacter sp.]|jgi:diguanylate cyclase (GGDEF)-like protein/putative nucleotidyltransferase with HDIG domain|nr:HDOD domain-containing protein [Conexibacter sp.]